MNTIVKYLVPEEKYCDKSTKKPDLVCDRVPKVTFVELWAMIVPQTTLFIFEEVLIFK